jgi:Phosphoserine phosphatase RsbU, N-terminal domain
MIRDAHERFQRDYAPAFLQYLSDRGEAGRKAAYELGRRAMAERLSVLDLARIHHTILLDVLKTHRTSQELEHIAEAASEFLVEALATFEMTQRGFVELQATARSRQEHARPQQDPQRRRQPPRPPERSDR